MVLPLNIILLLQLNNCEAMKRKPRLLVELVHATKSRIQVKRVSSSLKH